MIALGILLLPALFVAGVYIHARTNISQVAPAPITADATQFDGRYLLAASDADMIATAYADGVLRQIPGDEDTLSLVELPATSANARVIELPASNSVTSWPQIIAAAPDGNRVYVVETRGPVGLEVEQLDVGSLPTGRFLTEIDLTNGPDQAVVTPIDVGENPAHIGISADSAYLAVGLQESGRQLAIMPTATLDNPATFQYFPVLDSAGQPAREVSSVSWHPSGEFLAVGINTEEIQFYTVTTGTDGTTAVAPHGERISGGNTLSYGQFTVDGRHYLLPEINWSLLPRPFRNLNNPPGEMIALRFDATDAAQHEEVSRVAVGQSPEGFAVSPDGDLIVTVNMRRTYLPDALTFWPGFDLNSLSLLTFNQETGELRVIGEEYAFEGVLPEDAMFDADGDALGVVIYNYRDDPMGPGAIEFWNVIREGDEPRLERTSVKLDVTRGAHAMAFIP
jgi:DNA-binding beta-propeller fold protein YncE